MKMGWYKFLINFALWVGAIANLAMGILYLTGYIYIAEEVDPAMAYMAFPQLKTYDVIYGVGCCLLAVLQIVARFRLARYKKNGPALLNASYIIAIALSVLYSFLLGRLFGHTGALVESMTGLITSAVILLINIVYFKKRKELFVY